MGGGDKALIEIGGRTILDRVLETITPQCDGVILNANGDPSRFAQFGLPIVPDDIPDFAGPLAGILAGLDWAATHRPDITWMASVPGDCPFLPSDLVDSLHAARSAAGTTARLRQIGRLAASGCGALAGRHCARTCGARWSTKTCTRSRSGPHGTASRSRNGRTSRSTRSSTSTRLKTAHAPTILHCRTTVSREVAAGWPEEIVPIQYFAAAFRRLEGRRPLVLNGSKLSRGGF